MQAGRRAAMAAVLLALACSGWPVLAAEGRPTVAELAWIGGAWRATAPRATVEERWTPPAANAMLGLSRTLQDGRMTAFEFLRIVEREDGIFYVAQPGGRPPTEFKLTAYDGRVALFENPQHDYPRRIAYRRNDDGTLGATIDAGPGSEATTFTFEPLK
jgi:hypothetical protein